MFLISFFDENNKSFIFIFSVKKALNKLLYGKNNIINYSKEENSENTNDKNEQNYLNISYIYTKKLIVIIDN